MNVTFIYLFIVQMEVSSLRLKAFHNMGVVSSGDRVCLLTVELHLRDTNHVYCSFVSGHILPCEAALFCVLSEITHLLQVLSVCVKISLVEN